MQIFEALSPLSRCGRKRLCLALLLLASNLLSTGCATQEPVIITSFEVIREKPPAIWLADCHDYLGEVPVVENNGDLAEVVPPLVQALEQCTADKRALRAWAEPERTP